MTNITKSFKLEISKDLDNTAKGKFFEEFIAELLRKRGWYTTESIKFTGMQIDIDAYDLDFPQEKILVECKFSSKDNNNNNISAGVITDLIGKAVLRDIKKVILVSNQNLSQDAKGILEEEKEKIKNGKNRLVYLSFWNADRIAEILIESQGLRSPNLDNIHKNGGIINSITLLRTEHDTVWVAEEIRDKGISENAIIYPGLSGYNFNRVEAIVKQLWTGLNILDGNPDKDDNQLLSTSLNLNENISSIGVANSFNEQRPCRSEDFIGRSLLQEKFWTFLETIRDGKENTRVICLKGKSGLGRSSLLVKLTDDSRNNEKYNKYFYIYNVDVRSAREESGAIFVLSAIKKAIETAIHSGFVNLPNHKIIIDSIDNPLSSPSIQDVFRKLKSDNKIIVIWFDQFENMLIHQSFLSIYKAFERIVYDVDAINENIVLGFSWRTNITYNNVAYRMWDGLQHIKKELEELREFNEDEAKKYIDKFANANYPNNISTEIQDWILDNCSGYPWAMNKICNFFINFRSNSQSDYINQDINTLVKQMFTKDLEDIKNLVGDDKCLRYVAKELQVSSGILNAEFSEQIIKTLENKKVLLKIGNNYVIYWELFKDFILNPDSLPKISVEYKFIYPIQIGMDILNLCINSQYQFNNYHTIASKLKIQKTQVRQIISDFKKVQFLHIDADGNIVVDEKIRTIQNKEEIEKYLANILAKKLIYHTIIEKIYSEIKPQQEMTRVQFNNLLKEVYPGLQDKTYQDYWSKMLPWFSFAGLLEIKRENFIVRPKGEGRYKGKSRECGVNPPKFPEGQLDLLS